LVELAGWEERFSALGVGVAAMTYDSADVLAEFHKKNNLPYPLLRDEAVKHFEAYGVRDEHYGPGNSGYGVPRPGILFITPEGVVGAKFALPGFRNRPSFEEIHRAIVDGSHGLEAGADSEKPTVLKNPLERPSY